jgi:tRNA U34 5-methylaminomethyl-2-thiouridine-forming methyltransferase MnmC
MEQKPALYTTNDGSHTLYIESMDETYHSRNGAIEESMYVFIEKGLKTFVLQNPAIKTIHIFEVGFGTGLNAILTYLESKNLNISIVYHSIEAYPLDISLIEQLNYGNQLSATDLAVFKKMHHSEWGIPIELSKEFTLIKYHHKLEDFDTKTLQNTVNVIFMDAFAPNKQAEMWEISIFEKLYQLLTPNGILVTYTSKGDVKRAMQQVGLTVEKLAGPPRKRHMLRGNKS